MSRTTRKYKSYDKSKAFKIAFWTGTIVGVIVPCIFLIAAIAIPAGTSSVALVGALVMTGYIGLGLFPVLFLGAAIGLVALGYLIKAALNSKDTLVETGSYYYFEPKETYPDDEYIKEYGVMIKELRQIVANPDQKYVEKVKRLEILFKEDLGDNTEELQSKSMTTLSIFRNPVRAPDGGYYEASELIKLITSALVNVDKIPKWPQSLYTNKTLPVGKIEVATELRAKIAEKVDAKLTEVLTSKRNPYMALPRGSKAGAEEDETKEKDSVEEVKKESEKNAAVVGEDLSAVNSNRDPERESETIKSP